MRAAEHGTEPTGKKRTLAALLGGLLIRRQKKLLGPLIGRRTKLKEQFIGRPIRRCIESQEHDAEPERRVSLPRLQPSNGRLF
jgi:hypothetical protein